MYEFTNKEIAAILSELADLKQIKGENKYRVRAYSGAARRITSIDEDLYDLVKEDRLQEINGIGSGIAGTIREIFMDGVCTELEELKTELPPGVREMINIPGIGPVRAHDFYYKLGVTGIAELKEALQEEKIRKIKGYGKKTENKLLEFLEEYEQYRGKMFIPEALEICDRIRELTENLDGVERLEPAGDVRRRKESVGKLIFLIECKDREQVISALTNLDEVIDIEKVEESASYRAELTGGLLIYFYLTSREEFPLRLVNLTGSKSHFRCLQERAEELGRELKEDVILEDGNKVKITEEKELYSELDLEYIIPELREDRGEIEAAKMRELPESIQLSDIRGDLHIHTDYSDGAYSLEQMVKACSDRGYSYMGITDHSRSLQVAHGLSVDRVYEQIREIERLQEKYDIQIISGIEADILLDGSLDYDDEVLSGFELVIASIHTGFGQSQEQITDRIISAMENDHVNIVAHPRGRILGRRSAYRVDMEKVISSAASTGTSLEINASPYRLDLDDKLVRRAADAGVKIAINTDAHHGDELEEMALGVGVARRGWLEKDDVINTWQTEKLITYLRGE
ncbi:MAG: DNA polymerase/3'-5' exonuclease PolX [Halanaerobiaceae bacterium]